jgi:hypothetical protein
MKNSLSAGGICRWPILRLLGICLAVPPAACAVEASLTFEARTFDAGSAVRRAYPPWQKVYDVGFRVIVEDAAESH